MTIIMWPFSFVAVLDVIPADTVAIIMPPLSDWVAR